MQSQVLEKLRKLTNHKYVKLTDSGNKAIFLAIYIAKQAFKGKHFLIPDQAGWFTYKTYPKILGLKVKEYKTNLGITDLKDLKTKLKDSCGIIINNPAGYYANQDIEEIYKICKDKCLVILDASGSIGTDQCNGKFADITIGSFGRWKPINLGYGGFISAIKKEYFDDNKDIFTINSFYPVHKGLLAKLNNLKKRMDFLYSKTETIKKDLNNLDILHKDRKGINVIVRYKNNKEKTELINYCEKNKLEYTECPRYIRVNEKAISIEVKRLEQ